MLVSTIQFPSWAIDPLVTDQTLCAANAECSVLDMLSPDKCPEQIPIVSNVVDDTVVMAYNSANGTEVETKDMDNDYFVNFLGYSMDVNIHIKPWIESSLIQPCLRTTTKMTWKL